MPFPYSEPFEDDIFDPDYEPPAEGEEEEDNPDDYNEYAVRPLTAPMDTETLHNLYMGAEGMNRLPPAPYERGILDSPEYWMSDQMLGAGSMRPSMQEWDYRGSVGPPPTPDQPWTRPGADGRGPVREAGLTPPYGTRREPITNPVRQDTQNIQDTIDQMVRQQQQGGNARLRRDIEEQGEMIHRGAPGMTMEQIIELLKEQINQQYPMPAHGGAGPEDEDFYYDEEQEEVPGRRIGRRY